MTSPKTPLAPTPEPSSTPYPDMTPDSDVKRVPPGQPGGEPDPKGGTGPDKPDDN